MNLSAQLYTVIGYIRDKTGFISGIKKIRDIGYNYVQYLDAAGLSPKEVKAVCDDSGIKISSSHFSFDDMFENTEKFIDMNLLWEAPYIGTGSMPERFSASADGYKEFAQRANILGERFKKYGIRFTYHNHWFEFLDFGGKTGFDILTEETDPDKVLFEIDVCWAKYGGQDPAELLRQLSGRIEHIHFKDLYIKEDGDRTTSELGQGILDWPQIVSAAKKGGTVFAAVEQDVCSGNPFDSLRQSFDFCSKMIL